ncbi:GNAT family N-acetyltransferase [Aureisphaera galaxeae]|uniref:GNAT family N-acetyltransferase n=1 Tax=Aureisphaera galaxeae TaxID=1538023 RepID=UPI0023504A73|nr:GNAT family N-acetyltransferase [Aureisphaera galaxeae]MDC8006301.1 GNAT family N-acetyltransferase [Aureisphaera galaxeae]
MSIQRLDWDSNFFEFEVGRWEGCNAASVEGTNINSFRLLYQISDEPCMITLVNFTEGHAEVKMNFKKDLHRHTIPFEDIHDAKSLDLDRNALYELAYESGKYSRFKLDPKMKNAHFEALYRLWIDNSIDADFSDGFLVKIIEEMPAGMVTYRSSLDVATIGLIAVSPQFQGRGIGRELLAAAENHAMDAGMKSMVIPTQKSNEIACKFYEKSGYSLAEAKHIKHLWRDSF